MYGDMVEVLRIEKEIRDRKHPDCRYAFQHDGHQIRDFRKAWA